jgi:hypothetical protein
LKSKRKGSTLVQEKFQEEEAGDKRQHNNNNNNNNNNPGQVLVSRAYQTSLED